MGIWNTLKGFAGDMLNVPGDVVGSLPGLKDVGKAINVVGNTLKSESSKHELKDQQKRAYYENEINRDFQSGEAKLQRDWSAGEAEKSRQFDTQEREAQQSWQEKMIQQQNDYNSPLNQVKLMQAAGLSPANFDGQVSNAASPTGVPSGSSVGVPSGASAGAPATHLPQSVDSLAPYLQMAEIRRLNAEADKLSADADDVRGMAPEKVKESQKRQSEIDANISLVNKNLQKVDSEIAVNSELKNLYNKDGQLKEKDLQKYEERYKAELEQIRAETGWKLSNAWSCWSEMVKNMAESKMFKAQTGYYGQLAKKVKEETRGFKLENDVLELFNGVKMDWINENGDKIKATLTKSEDAKQSQADSDKSTASVIDLHNGWLLDVDGDTGDYTPVAIGLQVLDFITSQAGRVFGASASYSNGNYSTIADTHATVNSTSKSTINSTSKSTNVNHNHNHSTKIRKR